MKLHDTTKLISVRPRSRPHASTGLEAVRESRPRHCWCMHWDIETEETHWTPGRRRSAAGEYLPVKSVLWPTVIQRHYKHHRPIITLYINITKQNTDGTLILCRCVRICPARSFLRVAAFFYILIHTQFQSASKIIIIIIKDKGPKPLTCHKQWNTNIKTTVRRNVKQSKSNKQQSVLLKNDELSPRLKLRKYEKSVLWSLHFVKCNSKHSGYLRLFIAIYFLSQLPVGFSLVSHSSRCSTSPRFRVLIEIIWQEHIKSRRLRVWQFF